MMEYQSVSSPVWTNAAHTMITVSVVFPSISETPVKFNASGSDVEDYGRQMFSELMAGKYGVIAEG